MTFTPAYAVSKRRQLVSAIATGIALIAVIATAQGHAAVAAAAVAAAAAASAIASPSVWTAVGNFVVGAGLFGAIAILVANEGVPSGDDRALLIVAAAVPLAALVGSAFITAGRIEKDPGLDFERHMIMRAASTAFATSFLVALALTIVDVVSESPVPPPAVFLFVCANAFVVAYLTERRRMS